MQVSGLPCPNQNLVYQTHPQSSMSNITSQMEMAIQESGNVVYTITTGIKRKNLYTVAISVVGHEGVVQVLMLNFSELVSANVIGTLLLLFLFNLATVNFQVHTIFNTVMYTLTTPPTYLWSVHLSSTQQHQGLY